MAQCGGGGGGELHSRRNHRLPAHPGCAASHYSPPWRPTTRLHLCPANLARPARADMSVVNPRLAKPHLDGCLRADVLTGQAHHVALRLLRLTPLPEGVTCCSAAPWLYPTCSNENRRVTASGARRDLKELPVLALSGAFQPTNHEPPSATCRGIARGSEGGKAANLPGTVS